MGRLTFTCHSFYFQLLLLFSLASSATLCSHDQSSALLQFKQLFSVINSSSLNCDYYSRYYWRESPPYCEGRCPPHSKTLSWTEDIDCCSWDGVTCDPLTGHVIGLDLSCSWLQGNIPSHTTLFLFSHLQTLNLAFNNFNNSTISSDYFRRFPSLTHLNLSNSNFSGHIPSEISHMSKLVSLDLSSHFDSSIPGSCYDRSMILENSVLKGLVQNLTSLRELFLDCVNMYTIMPNSFTNLSSSLASLSLNGCGLQGNFPDRIFHLPNLQILSLAASADLTVNLPKTNWSTPLKVLDVSGTNLSGELPNSIGKLVSLKYLDLHACTLYGLFPASLSNLTQLTYLSLWDNNFTGRIPSSLSNLRHLHHLILSWNNFNGEIPDIFVNLTQLAFLYLARNQLVGQIPSSITGLQNLVEIFLSYNSLTGPIPSQLFTLPSLMSVGLTNNYLTGPIDDFQSNSLQEITLGNNRLQGSIPSSIFDHVNLTQLDLSSNNLSVILQPYMFAKLKKLEVLNLSNNSQILVSNGFKVDTSLPKLRSLDLSSCNLNEFPEFLGSLDQLEKLDLSNNPHLSVSTTFKINSSLPKLSLPKLWSLDLSSCNLTEFPEFLRNLDQLKELDLSNNTHLPVSTTFKIKTSLPKLESLDLSSCNLNEFPEFLGSLDQLKELDLSNNPHLSVSTTFKISSSLPKLKSLDLSSCNLIEFPEFVRSLDQLERLDLSNNPQLSVHTTFKINSSLPKLWSLYLHSCNLNEFPEFLRSQNRLGLLDLSDNKIQGRVPNWMWDIGNHTLQWLNLSHNFLTNIEQLPWKNLRYLDLSRNFLKGPLPIPPPELILFSLSNNNFTGEIPPLICSMTTIEIVDLSNNNLSGMIPECMGNISSLHVLDLRKNKFYGTIPGMFAKGNCLRTLNLNDNGLEGPVSQSLVNCTKLEVLDLGNNRINDTFPYWLGSLPELKVLILHSNQFYGSIWNSFEANNLFPNLRIFDLSNNFFCGPLPVKYFQNLSAMMNIDDTDKELHYIGEGESYYHDSVIVTLKGFQVEFLKIITIFTTIDFSNNNFSGKIPEIVGKLHALKLLNLSHNSLVGCIPSELENLQALESLDLSSNKLVGKIPWQLTRLNFLQVINLSNNQLAGPIPQDIHFGTFPNTSFEGNLGLCGFPLSNQCITNETSKSPLLLEDDAGFSDGFGWKVVLMGYGCGIVFGAIIGYLVFSMGKPQWLIRIVEGQRRSGGGPNKNHRGRIC